MDMLPDLNSLPCVFSCFFQTAQTDFLKKSKSELSMDMLSEPNTLPCVFTWFSKLHKTVLFWKCRESGVQNWSALSRTLYLVFPHSFPQTTQNWIFLKMSKKVESGMGARICRSSALKLRKFPWVEFGESIHIRHNISKALHSIKNNFWAMEIFTTL